MAANLFRDRGNTIYHFPSSESLVFRSAMKREMFHRFVLANPEQRIERDKTGVITIHPPMTFDSGYFEGEAFGMLRDWSKSNALGRAFSPSTSFDLPDGSQHKADGSWLSMERINQMSRKERRTIAEIVPDFVMEVRSQHDNINKLKRKMADVWIANGVRLAWLIDPLKQKAWVYRSDGTVESVTSFDAVLSGETVLPAFVFDLSQLKGE